MKKNIFLRKALAMVSVFALAALVMVGCKKDEVNPSDTTDTIIPDEPVTPSHFYYANDTLTINNIIKMDMQGLVAYEFILNNNRIFTIMSVADIDSNGTTFTDVMTFLFGGTGTIGIFGTENEEEDDIYVASGTVKIYENNGKYEIICKAVTESNDSIDIYYNGPIFDMNQPTGTGSITVDGTEYALQVGVMGQMDGMYSYEFFDTQMMNTLDIASKNALGNGTYTITDDDATVAAGNGIDVEFDIINPTTEEEIDGQLTDGSLTCSINGDTYTINFSGNSILGTVSGNFTGSITEVQLDKAAKKNINTTLAKMRK